VFSDQVKYQIPSEIWDMIYTIGPVSMGDEEFLRVVELASKSQKETMRDHKTGDSKSYKHHDEK
jgi:hypothetical protein